MKKMLTLTLLAAVSAASAMDLTGAGSSFVYPLFTKMFSEYKTASGDQVNYQSIGSGGGQKQLLSRTIDFAGSDVAIPQEDVSKYPGKVLAVPDAIGAVVVSYNVPGVSGAVKFSGKTIADIFLGNIKTWNDAALTKLNPGVTLPPLPITVVHRSDGSGTTGVFTEYLNKVSPAWKSKVGSATAVSWPLGVGAKGNDGVAGAVKSTPGAIGYIELTYALVNKIDFGDVQNRAGNFVRPSIASVQAAANGVILPPSGVVSITNASGQGAYPISTYTYALFYQDQKYGNRSQAQAQALKNMLTWVVTKGQQYNEPLNYAALPDASQVRARNIINQLTYGGQALK